MTYQINVSHNKLDKVMTSEQLNQILEAILDGKYSWACVLMLRFAGHNPLHYIPYRTYNRLEKQNCQNSKHNKGKTVSRISDLPYIEVVDKKSTPVRGGYLKQRFGFPRTNHQRLSVVTW